MGVSSRDIPFFIISFNRLSCLERLVEWLNTAGHRNIVIVDNNSSEPGLVRYLESSPYRVVRLRENMGHLAVWKCGLFDQELSGGHYAVSDCDVVPDENCPYDLLDVCLDRLQRHPLLTKVGPALRIDDLPDHFAEKETVMKWESKFWAKPYDNGRLYIAPIDTALAVYRPCIFPDNENWWIASRTAPPYVARHLPWYEHSDNPSAEALFYAQSIQPEDSHWSTDVSTLREDCRRLRQRVVELELENKMLSQTWRGMAYQLLRKAWKRWKYRNVTL